VSLYTDVIRYPDLFMNIFRRELYGKYRGSVLGLAWTLINPLALMAVYTLVFSVLLKAFQIKHYPLFVLTGLLTWVFFQSAVQMACSSLFGQPTLAKQARFPRQMLPLAVVATNVVTLAAMLVVVLVVNLIFIPEIRTTFWAALPLLVLLVALASGLAVVFGYLTVVYRDVEHLMNTIFLPWFFITPIFYTPDETPGVADHPFIGDLLTWANPIAPFIQAVRDILYSGTAPGLDTLAYVLVAGALVLAAGRAVFARMQGELAVVL
jgi:ABC-type polysaccharide/polyol phosphate export permease